MTTLITQIPTYAWFGLLALAIMASSAYLGHTLNQLRKDQRAHGQ